jgi:hypothetical protein
MSDDPQATQSPGGSLQQSPGGPLQHGIVMRQTELHTATRILAKHARKLSLIAAVTTTSTIVLGAIVATRDALDPLYPNAKHSITLTYTFLGVLIAAVGGIEAAFRFRDKAAKLHSLTASCESTIRQVDALWRKEVAPKHGPEKDVAANRLMDIQNESLKDVVTEAAEIGISIPYEIGEAFKWEPLHPA